VFSSSQKEQKEYTEGQEGIVYVFLFEDSVYIYFLIKAFCTRLYLAAPKGWMRQHKYKNTLLF